MQVVARKLQLEAESLQVTRPNRGSKEHGHGREPILGLALALACHACLLVRQHHILRRPRMDRQTTLDISGTGHQPPSRASHRPEYKRQPVEIGVIGPAELVCSWEGSNVGFHV